MYVIKQIKYDTKQTLHKQTCSSDYLLYIDIQE